MDKNVYNMKVEKIQKQARSGDYETAAKICDTIDWSQVRSARMLTLVSSVYENVHEYDRAIDILLMAYEEAPVGRRYLYKLTELAIQAGEIREAEEYYKTYLKEAAQDPARYLLRYKLAEAKGENLDKRIAILETYKRQEFDEEWAVRLAELYQKAGRRDECVRLCDEIILWFGVGPCVEQAMEIKEKYEPLSDSQRERRANRVYYEEQLAQMAKESERAENENESENPFLKPEEPVQDDLPRVAISEETGVSFDESAFFNEEETEDAEIIFEKPTDLRSTREIVIPKEPSATREIPTAGGDEAFSIGSFVKSVMEDAAKEQEDTVTAQAEAAREEAAAAREDRMETLLKTEGKAETHPEPGIFAEAPMEEEDAIADDEWQEPLEAESVSEPDLAEAPLEGKEVPSEDEPAEDEPLTEILYEEEPFEAGLAPEVLDGEDAEETLMAEPEPKQMELVWDDEPETPQAPAKRELLFVGCANPSSGLNMAVDALRKAYEKCGGEVSQVAKISAAKLNSRGLLKSLPNLQGKDLIIDGANSLSSTILREIKQVQDEIDPLKFFVLLDRPAAIYQLRERMDQLPEEDDLPQIVLSETIPDPVKKSQPRKPVERTETMGEKKPPVRLQNVRESKEKLSRDTELTEEQFISQIKVYAASIDCVIEEDALDALYDVIDELKEDGDPLSVAIAEEVVEDAADEAERHSLGHLFHRKYNKEGKLILRAKHFD